MAAQFLCVFGFRKSSFRRAKTQRGTTAVEMALIAPVFFLLLIGMVETSLILLTQHLMENAAYNTSRLASTGYTNSGQSQQQTVAALLNQELQSLGSLIDVSKVSLTSTAYSSMSNIGVAGQGSAGMGATSQIVVYTIAYAWPIFTPMMSGLMGTNGKVNLSTRVVVANEPY